jgi:C-terminal peptidase prc
MTTMHVNRKRSFRAFHRIAAAATMLFLVPQAGFAASVTLVASDNQSVSRAAFIKAAVNGAGWTVPEGTMTVPYDKVPGDALEAVKAAVSHHALGVFDREGKAVNFQKTITRGEALALLAQMTGATYVGDIRNVTYMDVRTDADKKLVVIATEKNWMKPVSSTMFGLRRPLKGKEGKLLLSRAFNLAEPTPNNDASSSPVMRIKLNGTTTKQPVPKADLLNEVWNMLREGFLYEDRVKSDTAGDKAIEGLVNSLADPYTVYMPKSRNADFQQQMKGEVEGIGATVEMTGGILTVVSPLRGSPAEKAGVKPKDKIISVDGEKLQGMTLDEAVQKVRGPKGSTGTFRIQREGTEFELKITREKVVIPEVDISYESNGVAVVKILQFWDTTDTKFRDAMTEVQSHNPKGIILDLRNNPGGLLHAAGVVVGTFLPKGSTFVSIMERSANHTEATTDEPVIKNTVPLVILVNKGSASASEIVTGALQDAKRGQVVGETTYGKGTVQQVVQFNDGSSLKYTIAEWRTPQGRKIDKLGVSPDITIVNDGGKDAKDLQMEKARELLR